MMKLKKSSVVFAAALALNTTMINCSFADSNSTAASSSTVTQNATDNSVQETPNELMIYVDENGNIVNEVADLEQQMAPKAGSNYARIQNMKPSDNIGKTIILVHEGSSNEYLEVFTQKDEDGKVLEPVNIFKGSDGSMINTAAVSTAGTFNGKQYVTPAGNYKFDYFQTMHYSKAYNDAPMPFAMFFNDGIAIHGITPSEKRMLGRPASHGCVRTDTPNAEALFNYITPAKKANAVVEVLAPVAKQ